MEEVVANYLRQKGVDLDQCVARFDHDEAFYLRYLYRYVDDKTFERVNMAIHANDRDAELEYCHTLKGVSANVGLKRLNAACIKMCDELYDDEYEKADETFRELTEAHFQAVELIRSVALLEK